jgi:hypothetical protein
MDPKEMRKTTWNINSDSQHSGAEARCLTSTPQHATAVKVHKHKHTHTHTRTHNRPQNYMEVRSRFIPRKVAPVPTGQVSGYIPATVWTLWRKESSFIKLCTASYFRNRSLQTLNSIRIIQLWSSSLCNFHHLPSSSGLLHPNIILST